MKSIIQKNKECIVCGRYQVEEHHIYKGIANRKKSEKYGLKVYLCYEHHRGNYGIHGKYGHNLDLYLKKIAQKTWQEYYGKTKDDFLKEFRRNYIND